MIFPFQMSELRQRQLVPPHHHEQKLSLRKPAILTIIHHPSRLVPLQLHRSTIIRHHTISRSHQRTKHEKRERLEALHTSAFGWELKLSERVRLVIASGLFVHRREAQQLESVGIGLGARYPAHWRREKDAFGMEGHGWCRTMLSS
jgi:hypothetical protein